MNTQTAKPSTGTLMPKSIIADMAERFGMEKEAFQSTLTKTLMPANTSNEQVAAFLVVAKHYDLNPFTKEVFAFPAKGGGIQPVVSIDGWLKIINSNPHYDGMEFKDHIDDKGELVSITCRIYHKHRTRPIEVTEYMDECRRSTEPWKNWPARMLRHKAVIQCARYAFGFSGIIEPDEYERMEVVTMAAPVGSGAAGLRRAVSGPKAEQQPAEVEHQGGERAEFTASAEEGEPIEHERREPAQEQTQQRAADPKADAPASGKPAGRRRPGIGSVE